MDESLCFCPTVEWVPTNLFSFDFQRKLKKGFFTKPFLIFSENQNKTS